MTGIPARAVVESHRAKLVFAPSQVRALLNLPEDVGIIGLYCDNDPETFCVVLSSERFEEQPPNVEAPVIPYSDLFPPEVSCDA